LKTDYTYKQTSLKVYPYIKMWTKCECPLLWDGESFLNVALYVISIKIGVNTLLVVVN